MKLYIHPVSNTSRPVMMFAADQGIDVDLEVVDLMTGAHYQQPYADLNPNNRVPTLVDDDFVLTESSAILKYLADKIDSPTYPKGLRERARVNEIMDWFNTGFYRELAYHLVYPQVYDHHKRPEGVNEGVVRWGSEKLHHWLGVLENHILGPDQRYVAGDEITIADYLGSGLTASADLIGEDFDGYPNIQAWRERLEELPHWAEICEAHYGFAESLEANGPYITATG